MKARAKKSTTNNLRIWEQVCVTDYWVTKSVQIGSYHFTTVCAQSQRKRATELWGPMGQRWGIRNPCFEIIRDGKSEPFLLAFTAEFYYPEGSIPMAADILLKDAKGHMEEDAYKKVRTSALSKVLSELGFNSDVFEGLFDNKEYISERLRQSNGKGAPKAKAAALPPAGSAPRPVPPVVRAAAVQNGGGSFLATMERLKAQVGVEAYFKVLGANGFESAEWVIKREDQAKVYRELKAMADKRQATDPRKPAKRGDQHPQLFR